MKKYKKVLISYEDEECVNFLFLCKHSNNLEELKQYIDGVMKTRKVYTYNIRSISDTNEEDIEDIKRWSGNERVFTKTERSNKKHG